MHIMLSESRETCIIKTMKDLDQRGTVRQLDTASAHQLSSVQSPEHIHTVTITTVICIVPPMR